MSLLGRLHAEQSTLGKIGGKNSRKTEIRNRQGAKLENRTAMSGFGRRAEAGFNAHLPKPASLDGLKAAIGKL